jgi:hypothetical protein
MASVEIQLLVGGLYFSQTNVMVWAEDWAILNRDILLLDPEHACYLLDVLGSKRKLVLGRLEIPTLVTLIERVMERSWPLSAEIVRDLDPLKRRAVGAQLPGNIKNIVLKTLDCLQDISRLEFTTSDGEFHPDSHVMTESFPADFPTQLRTCRICNQAYTAFDEIEMDYGNTGSSHEGVSCPRRS